MDFGFEWHVGFQWTSEERSYANAILGAISWSRPILSLRVEEDFVRAHRPVN